MDGDAGLLFLRYVRSEISDLPLLLLSSEADNRETPKQFRQSLSTRFLSIPG